MKKTSALMARVPVAVLEDVRQVAQYEGTTLAKAVAEALEIWVESRKNDPAFQQLVRDAIARGQRILEDAGNHEEAANLVIPAVTKERAKA